MFTREVYEVLCPFHSTPFANRVPLSQSVLPTCSNCKKRLLLEGRYALRGVLGEGGFGRVYWALDVANDFKRVTVKQAAYQGRTMRDTDKRAEVIAQMISESQVLKKVKHRQIPELLGLFAEDLEVFLVEEYMTGESLSELSEKARGINGMQARQVLEDMIPVLLYLHNGFIVPLAHNDISPKNIITPAPERQYHALIDLGSARQPGNSVAAMRSYHPVYAAPEVIQSYEIGADSDQYSLGVTVISAMTGESPRKADRAYEFWQANLQQIARRERDDTLVAVLEKMTQVNPRDRYSDIREVLRQLTKSQERVAVSPASLLSGGSGYRKIHDLKLKPFGILCRDFQSSRDMGTVAFRAGAHELHVIDVNGSRSILSLLVGVSFRYKLSPDGRWVVVRTHQSPKLRGIGLSQGGVFVVELSTGEVTVVLDNASLSPAMVREIDRVSLDEDSLDDSLIFSSDSQHLFFGLHAGLVMSWCCSDWKRAENYRKERGATTKFCTLVAGRDGLLLAGDGSTFVVFEEGNSDPIGELSIPSRTRSQRILPWDGNNTWVAHRAELIHGGKHTIEISSCDLHDSLPHAMTHTIRELSCASICNVAACPPLELLATTSAGECFVRIYNSDLEQIDILSTPSHPKGVIFSPRGNYLFVCGETEISVFRRS